MRIQKLHSITRIAVPAIAESLAAVIVTSIDTKMVSSLGLRRFPESPLPRSQS